MMIGNDGHSESRRIADDMRRYARGTNPMRPEFWAYMEDLLGSRDIGTKYAYDWSHGNKYCPRCGRRIVGTETR